MLPNRIGGATRYLGAPAGWDPETDGDCSHLAIRDIELTEGKPCMISSWQPTPEELEQLNKGGSVNLFIWGSGHPPVALTVDPVKS